MVVSYIDRRLMYAEANRKQKVSKQRKFNSINQFNSFCIEIQYKQNVLKSPNGVAFGAILYWNSIQNGYLGFSIFLDFDPQNFQKQVFLEKVL